MSKSNFQCDLCSLFGRERIRDQRAKPDGGDRAGSVGERDPRIAKRIGGCHAYTPLFEARRCISDERGAMSSRRTSGKRGSMLRTQLSSPIRLTERGGRQTSATSAGSVPPEPASKLGDGCIGRCRKN